MTRSRHYWVQTNAFGSVFCRDAQQAGRVAAVEISRRLSAVAPGTSVPHPDVSYIDGQLRSVDLKDWNDATRRRFTKARDAELDSIQS